MRYEKSCGAVVFTKIDGEIKYLIIKSLNGVYGFPKGHVEPGESEEQTALREINEEVGLRARLLHGFRVVDEYPIPRRENVIKQVVYFLGEYDGQDFTYQKEELSGACLLDYESAMSVMQFESNKRILTEANSFLSLQNGATK